jgi:hypothetical protein
MTDGRPSAEEIEQRKQVRAGHKSSVEQARSAPTPDKPAPAENAPEHGVKENTTDE